MSRSRISGTGTIFHGKPTAVSWRSAKSHRSAITNIFPRSRITAGTVRQDFKYKKTVIVRCLQGSSEMKARVPCYRRVIATESYGWSAAIVRSLSTSCHAGTMFVRWLCDVGTIVVHIRQGYKSLDTFKIQKHLYNFCRTFFDTKLIMAPYTHDNYSIVQAS